MKRNQLIDAWLKKADEDFYFASNYLEDEQTFFGQLCFHYHQAAEKYLKSFIVAYNLTFRKIHNLKELMQICQEKDASFSDVEEQCIYLNQFYIDTRYPVHWPTSFTREDTYKAKGSALVIGDFVKNKLSSIEK